MKTYFLHLLISAGLAAMMPAATAQSTVPLPDRNLVKLLADYGRPKVYGLNRGVGALPGTLLALNPTNGQALAEISVDLNPTDMAMTGAGDALYIINTGSRTLMRVDLGSFAITATRSFATPNTYDPALPLHVAAGRPNLVYFTDAGWSPGVYTFDFANGTVLADFDDDNGAGGLAVTRDGATMFTWRQYGWSAGNVNSWVTRLDARNAALVPMETSFVSWRRDPFDTPVLLNAAETLVFNKQQMFSATNVSVLLQSFAENIYAISLDGQVALGDRTLFNAVSGTALTNFSFASTVQVLSGDQRRLFRYRSDVSEMYIYDMTQLASVSGPTPQPVPADGAAVALTPTNLTWSPSPVALSYRVFFGTNQAQVASANLGSSQYLGSVSTPGIALTRPMVPGGTYYWRLDVVGFASTNAGPVWSFTVSPVAVLPPQLAVGAIATFSPAAMTLLVTSAVARSWTARVAGQSWLTIDAGSGITPGRITVSFNTAALSPGTYSNRIDVTSGGVTASIPVTLDVRPLDVRKMVTDYQRPYIYALQPPPAAGQSGRLLFINTDTEAIDLALPIGENPTDLTIHYPENRLYIANWGRDETYVVDLSTRTLLPSLHLGADVYKINAGRAGRIIVEELDQWITVSIIDTTTGAVVGSMGVQREGDGEASPDGTVYYHNDNNISNAHIHKFRLTEDIATQVAASLQHPFGSRNLILSPDGTRLFWRGYVYDADLRELANLGSEIYATTLHGELAFTSTQVVNTRNGQTLFPLPVSSTVLAVAGSQQKVFLYDSAQRQLRVIPLSNLPGPGLVPVPADGSVVGLPLTELSWSVSPFALNYRVFFGTNAAGVAAATTNSPLFAGTVDSPTFPLSATLRPGGAYFWRVDAVGFSGTTTGAVWRFTAAPLVVAPQVVSVSSLTGLAIPAQTLAIIQPAGVPWTATAENDWLSVAPASGGTTGTITLTFSTTSLPSGVYSNAVRISAAGTTVRVPVSVELFNLAATRMLADRTRPYIYVLHRGSGNFDDAFLLFLRTDSGTIDKVLPIGRNPTDLSVNYQDRRLYVVNWLTGFLRVIDLDTRSPLQSLSVPLASDRVNAGRAGRIVMEDFDQWINAYLIDTANGATLTTAFFREGDGEFDPTGRYYYHCDNNSTGRALSKFDLNNSTFVSLGAHGGRSAFGSRNLVMSLNGSRLFWTGSVFDPDVVELNYLGAEIYASSTNGALAFSDRAAYDTLTAQNIYSLPVATTVMAVDRLDERLWYFNPGSARIESIPLSVIRAPAITRQPAGMSVGVGGSINLTVQARGYAPLAYQWRLNGTNLPTGTNFFLAINNAQPAHSGDYQAVVSNPYGAVTSAIARVTVLVPPAITRQPAGVAVFAGATATLTVEATGSAPLQYQWSFQGVALSGATNSVLALNNVQAPQEGVYRVSVSNIAGTADSALALLRVLPAGPTIVSSPERLTVLAGSNVQFSVTAVGSAPLGYQWWFSGSPLPGATAATLTLSNVQAAQDGAYQVVVANPLGSALSATATLTVTPSAPRFVTHPQSFSGTVGTNLTLTGLARGSEPIFYQWLRNGRNVPDAQGPSLALSNALVSHSGQYALLALNTLGAVTSSIANVVITGAPPVFVQQPANITVGAGASFTLNSQATGSPPITYQWHFQGVALGGRTNSSLSYSNVTAAQAGSYHVVAANAFGTRTSSVVNVVVTISPMFSIELTNQVVETGNDVLLAVSAGETNVSYSWQFRGQVVPSAVGPFLWVSNVQPAQAGAYRVTVANQSGAAASTMTLTVHPVPGVLLAWGDDTSGQANVPAEASEIVAAAGGDFHSLALQRDGAVVSWGYDGDGQATPPAGLRNVVAVAAGNAHNLALKLDGSILAWGRNDFGQTSVPANATSVVAVAAGDAHSLALRQDGSVLAWGDNAYGQRSVPPSLGFVVAIAAGRDHSVALRNNGTVVCWGLNSAGQAQPPGSLRGVTAIAAGYLHTLALLDSGVVTGWGDNTYRQLDIAPGLSNVVAVAAGDFHSLALRADGTVVAWGDNSFGQRDLPAALNRAFLVGAGYYHSLAVAPPTLHSEIRFPELILRWPGRYVLQRASDVTGPYLDFTDISPATIPISAGHAEFFRLRGSR